MNDMGFTLGFLALILLILGVLAAPRFLNWANQKSTDRRRKLAHAGKVQCEDEKCERVAVALTPNGYFCDLHWEGMSKRKLEGGGFVTWHHPLYHAVRRS